MEYGGELFHLSSNSPFTVPGQNRLPGDWRLYRSGRDALRAFARQAGKKRVLMPALCCASMILPFQQNGYEIAFYRLQPDFRAQEDDVLEKLGDDTVLLYMRYFGIRPFSDDFLEGLRREKSSVLFLEDRTHDILVSRQGEVFIPDAVAASLRKWAALPEGGMLKSGLGPFDARIDPRYGDMRWNAMEKKDRYFTTGDEALHTAYREESRQAEALLDESTDPVAMAPQYREIVESLDFTKLLEARRRNLRCLRKCLAPVIEDGIVRLMTQTPEDSGLYLPILIQNRDTVQQELIRRKIYCPAAIWPEPPEAAGACPVSHYVTEHMLSVLCDQRYTEEDMEYIADNLIEILKNPEEIPHVH